MKFWWILGVTLLLSAGILQAEWRRSGGPNGGGIRIVDVYDGDAWCIAGDGIHHLVDGKWRRNGSVQGAELKVWRDRLFTRDSKAKNRPVVVSDDGGASWHETTMPAPQTSIFLFDLNDIVHVRPEAIFVGVDKTVYRSTDGEEWAVIGSCEECRSGVARVFGTDNVIFVLYSGDSLLHRYSTDGVEMAPVRLPDEFTSAGTFVAGAADVYAISGKVGAFRSRDQGESWEEINTNFRRVLAPDYVPMVTSIAADETGLIVHDYEKTLWRFDGQEWSIKQRWINLYQLLRVEDRIYAAANEGMLISDDEGDNWRNDSDGLPYTNCVDMFAVDASLFAVTTYNVLRSDDNGTTWDFALDSAIHNFAIDGSTIYAVHGGRETRAVGRMLYRSDDLGQTWNVLNNDLRLGDPPYVSTESWNYGISDLCHDGQNLYVSLYSIEFGDGGGGGGNTKIWKQGGMRRSADGGMTWESISTGLPDRGDVIVPVIEILSNDRGLLINTEAGLYYSSDDGDTWQTSMNGIGPETEIRHIFGEGLTVFATAFSRINDKSHYFVYRSDDGGASWSEMVDAVNLEFPDWNLIPQRIDFVDGEIFMHTRTSAYYRLFKLENDSWRDVQSEVPVDIKFRQILAHNGNRYAASEGNGIWIDPSLASDVDLPAHNVNLSHRLYPNPFRHELSIETGAHRGLVRIELFNMAGVSVLQREVPAAAQGRLTLDIALDLPAGAYVVRITSAAGTSDGILLHD